jgi:hypothetical protein
MTSAEAQRSKELEHEVRELRKANEILKLASAFFAQAELDRPSEVMRAFVDRHRDAHGVEPICRVLQVARRATGAMRPGSVRCTPTSCSTARRAGAGAVRPPTRA